MTLRCSSQLLRRIGLADLDLPPSGRLGDWYARIVATRLRQLVLCTNERSLLCVVIPLAPQHSLLQRAVAAAQARINQIPARASLRMAEIAAMSGARVGRATSRSVIGSMTQFSYAVQAWLEGGGGADLDALGLWLCDTPCSPLKTHWPWLEAELLLTGAVAPERRPFKFSEHVI
jgi:hypothetical protein